MVPWAGTECTYTAWAHAGALSRASALTYYLYTDLPHQIPWLRLEEDIPTSLQLLLSAVYLWCWWEVAGKSMGCEVERWKEWKRNFFSPLLACIELFLPIPVGRWRFVPTIMIWLCHGMGQGCPHSQLRENIRSQILLTTSYWLSPGLNVPDMSSLGHWLWLVRQNLWVKHLVSTKCLSPKAYTAG